MAKHSMDDGASAYRGRGVQAERIAISETLPLSREEQERERVRRSLIYADMVQTLGRVEYRLLTTWPYQPTAEEVEALLKDVKASIRAGNGHNYAAAKARKESA